MKARARCDSALPEWRQAVLLDRLHLAEGARMPVGHEGRVVAEAERAARRPHQRAVDARLDLFAMIVRPGQAQRRDEVRLAPRRLARATFLQETFDGVIAAEKSLDSPAQRAEEIPGWPSSASTQSPELSGNAGSPVAFAAASALMRAFSFGCPVRRPNSRSSMRSSEPSCIP